MLNPNPIEISTNESPAQSPKRIQNENKFTAPYINIYLQKLKTEKKKEKEEKNKKGENSENDKIENNNENGKRNDKSDKTRILLDFDFLVGEFLDKIIFGKNKNNTFLKKENKTKKVDIIKRKKFTKIKTPILKLNILNKVQKSK